jgi:hypothetical protein
LHRVKRRLQAIVDAIALTKGYTFKFITLTIPNQPKIDDGVKFLLSCFKKLRRKRWWLNYVEGGAFTVEVTPGANGWHCHIHVIAVSRYIPVKSLSKKWQSVSGGKIVWITNLPIKVVVNYVAKYITKSPDLDEAKLAVSIALRNVRMFQPFGLFHKLQSKTKPKYHWTCPECGNHELITDDYHPYEKTVRLYESSA